MAHKLPLLLVVLLTTFVSSAQESYMDIIAKKTCECISEKSAVNPQLTEEELGICLLKATGDYRDQLLKDHDLNLENLAGNDGERLGELIGSRMAFTCPEVLLAAAGEMEEEMPLLTTTGTVTRVTSEPFVVFDIKQENGRTGKFYWFSFVSTDLDLQNSFEDLEQKTLQIEYVEQELFDPRIKEYKLFNVITAVYAAAL